MSEYETTRQPEVVRAGHARILVVDDDGSVRRVTVRLLAAKGLSVTGVASVEEALDLMSDPDAMFDVVLLDMTMPGLSGRRAIDAVGAARPGLPIVVMTGYSELATASLMEGRAVAGFIPKPFTGADLLAALEAALV